jgi:Mg2+ and Co2+ transporter CorA
MIKEHDNHIDVLRQESVGHKHLNATIAEFISMQKDINKGNTDKIQKLIMFQASITTIFTAVSIIAGFFGDAIMNVITIAIGGGK